MLAASNMPAFLPQQHTADLVTTLPGATPQTRPAPCSVATFHDCPQTLWVPMTLSWLLTRALALGQGSEAEQNRLFCACAVAFTPTEIERAESAGAPCAV